MKKFILLFALIVFHSNCYSQKAETTKGKVIKNYGQFYNIKDVDLVLKKGKKYQIIFDVYTDEKSFKKVNSNINTVARFLNMHEKNKTKLENLELVLILHGTATKNALTDEAFLREFKVPNPNSELIKALEKKDVKIYVCGQSFVKKGYNRDDLSKKVEIALSALTTLVYYQTEGYQLITFN